MIFGTLLVTTVLVSVLLGSLGKLTMKERALQTLAMGIAALTFYGLAILLQSSAH